MAADVPGHGFFGNDGRFLVAVIIEDLGPALWWAKVILADSWDLAGDGSAGPLGHGFGLPSFGMLSVDGSLVLHASRGQDDSSGIMILRDPRLVPVLRSHGEWMATWSGVPEVTRAAVRRWLDAHPLRGVGHD